MLTRLLDYEWVEQIGSGCEQRAVYYMSGHPRDRQRNHNDVLPDFSRSMDELRSSDQATISDDPGLRQTMTDLDRRHLLIQLRDSEDQSSAL